MCSVTSLLQGFTAGEMPLTATVQIIKIHCYLVFSQRSDAVGMVTRDE